VIPDFNAYTHVVVAFSGGKDSMACVLRLLEIGCPRQKIELWHHDVDGQEGSTLMDWPCTREYSRMAAKHLGLPIYFSWRVGGFEREMLRNGTASAPVKFEAPGADGEIHVLTAGGKGPTHNKQGEPYIRRRFPAQAADLRTRWCSAVLKIDVADLVLNNDPRFRNYASVLVVTGERREEGKIGKDGKPQGRAGYEEFEPHRTNSGRKRVDSWRAVIDFPEVEVWEIMHRAGIVPHPAYRLGFGRVSCATCIFGGDDQWASIGTLMPAMLEKIAAYEDEFHHTIKAPTRKEPGMNVRDRSRRSLPLFQVGEMDMRWPSYPSEVTEQLIMKANGTLPLEPQDIAVAPDLWTLPLGAFRKTGGPI
jgi:3'-phosphoadenosine 5'-phosphosulfate sulfotransferase (PAPS reductase)/FAD synthetase